VEAGADINITDNDGRTALQIAATSGSTDIAVALVEAGADINITDNDGRTALHIAATSGSTDIAQALVERKSDLNIAASDGRTALHMAACSDSTGIVLSLVNAGADLNTTTSDSYKALHIAAESGHNSAITLALVKAGDDLNSTTSAGYTALQIAAYRGSTDIALALVEAGADINIANKRGDTALHYAAYMGSTDIAMALVIAGADLNCISRDSDKCALDCAMDQNHQEIARMLVQYGAEHRALMQCIKDYDEDSAITILSTNPRSKDQLNMSLHNPPLHLAIYKGLENVVEKLLLCGADPQLKDCAGDTAADWAVMVRNYKIAASLIEKGSSLKDNYKNYEPILLLMQSIQDGDEDLAISILATNPPTKDQLNISVEWPPLHFAADKGFEKVVKKLLECGAKKDFPDVYGYKALELAVKKNHPAVVDLLASHENVNDTYRGIDDTLLGHAVIYGYEQVMTTLISKSADTTKIPSNVKIPSSLMLKWLDDGIAFAQEDKDRQNKIKIEDRKLLFDYQILVGKNQGTKSNTSETDKVKTFCNSSYLPELLPHPLIKTFIFKKWRKIEWAYGIWVCLKFGFLLSMLYTAIELGPVTTKIQGQTYSFTYSNSTGEFGSIEKQKQNETSSKTKADPINKNNSFIFNIIFLIIFGIAELCQIGNSFKTKMPEASHDVEKEGTDYNKPAMDPIPSLDTDPEDPRNYLDTKDMKTCHKKFPAYFTDVKNYIQWAILCCLAIILFDFNISLGEITHRYILGALLPLSCFEFLHEVGHIPGCTHIIQIYNMVLVTFLKYLAFYGLLIISFAASFFVILSIEEEDTNFGKLIAKHIVMSTGEQEFSDAPFSEEQHWFEVVFFITFTILIVVVMMAILNALAIVDIQEMMKEAEVPMLEQLLEKVLIWDNLLHSLGNCWKLNIRLFDSGTNNKENLIELYPFKNKSGFIGFIKKNIKWFANLFLYTYIVIDDKCIHGRGVNNGALQILSSTEERQKISKKEDEDVKRKKVDDVQLKQNHVDLKNQMKDLKNQMKDMKDQKQEMKNQMKQNHEEMKHQINQMNGEMKQMKQMNNEMKEQMTEILNLLITKH